MAESDVTLDVVRAAALANPGEGEVPARRVGVLVLGMHRSGSSAITRMLSLLGCALPLSPMPLAPDNPKGHWESQRVADFNDEILALAGTQWDDWQPVNPRLSETLIWPQLVSRGRAVLREEFGEAPLFVLKDPRICKLAGFWLEVLTAEGIEPAVVLPIRNPIEVARSLAQRDEIEENHVLLIWLSHILAAEAATRGRARVFTDFAALLHAREAMSNRLAEGLGVVWPRMSALSGAEIAQFLTPELRHHVSETAELTENEAITPWVRQAYTILLNWARRGEQPADYPVLDGISRAFNDAGVAFARPMLNGELALRRATQAEAMNQALTGERDHIAQRLADLEPQLAEAVRECGALVADRDSMRWRVGELESELQKSSAEHQARTMERDVLEAERVAVADARDKVAWRLGEVEAELYRALVERDARAAESHDLRAAHTALVEERNNLAWRLGEVDADLAHALCDRDAITRERNRLAGERGIVAEERDKLACRLGELDTWWNDAKAINEQSLLRISELEADLAVSDDWKSELSHRLTLTESTLRQREEEIAQMGTELKVSRSMATDHLDAIGAARNEVTRVTGECLRLRETISAESIRQSGRLSQMQIDLADSQTAWRSADDRADLAEIRREMAEQQNAILSAETKALSANLADLERRLEARSTEIVRLSGLHRANEQSAADFQERAEWLRQVYAVTRTTPVWWSLMPRKWRSRRELDRLRSKGLFDGAAYLGRYPDVRAAGIDPLQHFILHGIAENRSLTG